MNRTPLQQCARAALIGIPLVTSPFIPVGASLALLTLATVIAYDGIFRHAVWRVFLALLALELVFGMDVGMLVLPYLIGCLLWYATQRMVPLTPWSSADGWRIADGARSVLVAFALWAIMVMVSVVGEVYLYGNGMVVQRMTLAFSEVPWWGTVLCGIGILALLRRIDVPFRKRIQFGA